MELTPPAGSSRRKRVGALVREIDRVLELELVDLGAELELLELRQHLRTLPSSTRVPAELVAMLDQLVAGPRLGPTQRGFVERCGSRLFSHNVELLESVLCDETLRARGSELIDMYLEPELTIDAGLRAIVMLDDHDWRALRDYALERVVARFAGSAYALARALHQLAHAQIDGAALRTIARVLLEAIDRGVDATGVAPGVLSLAETLAGRRRKKKPAKTRPAKKRPAKTKPAKTKPVDQLDMFEGVSRR